MKIYISGPMTGYEQLNYPAFEAAAKHLRDAGFDVVSPHELNPIDVESWIECMKVDIRALLDCEGVAVLKDWGLSKGATLECAIAAALEMPIKPIEEYV